MALKFLDNVGFTYFWEKLKRFFLSDKPIENVEEEPYLIRKTGGEVNASGYAAFEDIVGGSWGWNQLIPTQTVNETRNGLTYVSAGNGVWTITGKSTSNNNFFNLNHASNTYKWTPNHVLYVKGASTYVRIEAVTNGTGDQIKARASSETILKPTSYATGATASWIRWQIYNTSVTLDYTAKPQVFDLTAMFGSTIANYIYNLETATAGAGVAWIKRYITKDYYAYQEPILHSVSHLVSHKTYGKNLMPQGRSAYATSTNTTLTSSGDSYTVTCSDSATYRNARISLTLNGAYLSGKKITFSANVSKTGTANPAFGLSVRDDSNIATEQYWSGAKESSNLPATVTFPEKCGSIIWVYFYVSTSTACSAGASATFSNVQIEVSESATAYEPYESHTYPFDTSVTVRGIPELDANNRLRFNGDIWHANGTVERRYAEVDLGSLGWTFGTVSNSIQPISSSVAFTSAKPPVSSSDIPNMITPKFATVKRSDQQNSASSNLNTISMTTGGYITVLVTQNEYASAAAFKTAMNGVKLVYELATPTTETSTPFAPLQKVDPDGIEEFTFDTGYDRLFVPHTTRYPINQSYKLPTLPDLSDKGDGLYTVEQSGEEMELSKLVAGSNVTITKDSSAKTTTIAASVPSSAIEPSSQGNGLYGVYQNSNALNLAKLTEGTNVHISKLSSPDRIAISALSVLGTVRSASGTAPATIAAWTWTNVTGELALTAGTWILFGYIMDGPENVDTLVRLYTWNTEGSGYKQFSVTGNSSFYASATISTICICTYPEDGTFNVSLHVYNGVAITNTSHPYKGEIIAFRLK